MAEVIKEKSLPREIFPFIIGITSEGEVAKGVKEILTILPHEFIDPENIGKIYNDVQKMKREFREI